MESKSEDRKNPNSISTICSSLSTTMINLFRQPILRTSLQASFLNSAKWIRRASTVSTTYSSFPSSLLRYNSRQKSSLYDRSECDQRADDPYWDGIEISEEDGLIHLEHRKTQHVCLPSSCWFWNLAHHLV